MTAAFKGKRQEPELTLPSGELVANPTFSDERPQQAQLPTSRQACCLVTPGSGEIVAWNGLAAKLLGPTSTPGSPRYLSELVPNLTLLCTDKTSSSDLHIQDIDIHNFNGNNFQAALSVTQLLGPKQTLLLVTIHPLDFLANSSPRCDALTGLPDRRELAIHRSRWQQLSSGTQFPHAVLFLDLDNFKQINDSQGHAAGDRLLVTLAARWQQVIRENDLLVRYGGDEFVILLAGVRQQQEIAPIVDRLLTATSEPITIEGQTFSVGLTIGIALAEDTSVDLDQLIAKADQDMYRLKRRPR